MTKLQNYNTAKKEVEKMEKMWTLGKYKKFCKDTANDLKNDKVDISKGIADNLLKDKALAKFIFDKFKPKYIHELLIDHVSSYL